VLKLNLTNTPTWLTLAPGVRLHLAPLTTALMVSARADPAIADLPDIASTEELAMAMAKAVARQAVLDWEGVGDADGNIVPVSPEGIDALLEVWPIFEAFQLHYISKGLLLDAEKNVSAPLPNGSSAGAQTTAQPALPSTTANPAKASRVTGKRAKTARQRKTSR